MSISLPIAHTTLASSAPLAAAGNPAESSLFNFQTALLIVVAAVLVMVVRHIATLNNRIALLEASRAPAPNGTDLSSNESRSIRPEVVAAISAAVHTTLKGRVRILSVGQICPNRQVWSAEGRRQVFSSHNVR